MSSLRELLLANPDGIREHDMLETLRDRPEFALFNIDYSDSLHLFQVHFILFHALYRLREKMLAEASGVLLVGPVEIVLQVYTAGSTGLDEADPLQDYYLQIDNLFETNREAVDDMLDRFWVLFGNAGQRAEALRLLGLEDPVEDTEIKQAYRRKLMQHHPDRGGHHDTASSLNKALAQLLMRT